MASLTLIMPVYNAAPYLREAVDSLLAQTFTDFELWLIDDGSTDASRAIMQSYTDARIRFFGFDHNRGRVAVVNEVVAQVTAPFFSITDADDASHPQRLQKQMEVLLKDESVMLCGTAYVAMNTAGKIFRNVKLPQRHELIYEQMPQHAQVHGPTTIIRRELRNAFTPLYRDYFKDHIADADLASRIVDRYRAANVPEALYAYRIVSTSNSRKNVSIRFLHLYKLIAFLSDQRRLTGSDSLEQNRVEEVDAYLNKIAEPYFRDASVHHRHAAFYHLYWHSLAKAWRSGWQAWQLKPYHPKNNFLLFYLVTKSVVYLFNERWVDPHYTTYFKNTTH
ncbi:MAG: glycosyltransferase family 2 protein [Cyclobacteriaceae bacterium]